MTTQPVDPRHGVPFVPLKNPSMGLKWLNYVKSCQLSPRFGLVDWMPVGAQPLQPLPSHLLEFAAPVASPSLAAAGFPARAGGSWANFGC